MTIIALGKNWYDLYPGNVTPSYLEYNTGSNPTAKYFADRKPQAAVFRHIDGDRVIAKIYKGTDTIETKFRHKDSDIDKAFELAKNYVEEQVANKEYVQLSLFD